MWQAKTIPLNRQTTKITIWQAHHALTFRNVFDLCATSTDFADFLTATLTASEFVGFYWELPALTSATINAPFECVLVNARLLTRLQPDASSFSNQFARLHGGQTVAAFSNLGGDARLIAPAPISDNERDYPHLAAFLRSGQTAQIREFWQVVGREANARLSTRPFWLSTAGLGVIWLHLRLDSRPKYYKFAGYRAADYL